MRNSRLGRPLSGTRLSSNNEDYDFNAAEGFDIPIVINQSGRGSSVPRSYYDALARAAERNAQTNEAKAQAAFDKINLDAFKFQQEQDLAAAALARQQAGAAQQLKYLQGQLGAGIPSEISGNIDLQETQGRQYIQDQAAELLRQLQGRESASRGLTQTGYSNLMNYLARTPPTAFAQAQRAVPTITQSGLGQYMAGQGVSPAAAQEAATLANIQAAGGASNYNQLLNVLAAQEQAAQASRQREAEMGLATQLATLQNIYGGATSGLEQSRLSALAELASRVSNARLLAQREATARNQAIQDAIAALLASGLIGTGTTGGGTTGGGTTGGGTTGGGTTGGGTTGGGTTGGGTTGGGTTGGGTTGGAAPVAPVRPIDALAERAAKAEAAGNTRLADRIENFIEANPNAGIKKIEKEFPQIGAAIRATPQPDPVSQAQAQAAQAALNQYAPVEVNAPNPLIALNPLPVAELLALIGQAQYAPGYGEPYRPSTFDPNAYGNEMTMY